MKQIKNIVIYCASLTFFGILLELYFQGIEFEMPYHQLHPALGKKMIPKKRVCYFNEGFYLGAINQYGYLGQAYPSERSPESLRIALFGDSYTEGFQLFRERHFSYLLEERLNRQGKQTYEVLNFGVSDYRYSDMAIQYRLFAQDFQPDVLLFLIDNTVFLPPSGFLPAPRLMQQYDSLTIDYSFRESNTFRQYNRLSCLVENSCLVKSLSNCYKLAIRGELNNIILGKFTSPGEKKAPIPHFKLKQLPAKVPLSFDWYKDKTVYFVFRDQIPEVFLKASEDYPNIQTYSLSHLLDESDHYWKISKVYGHWNEEAQRKVADYLIGIISD